MRRLDSTSTTGGQETLTSKNHDASVKTVNQAASMIDNAISATDSLSDFEKMNILTKALHVNFLA